MEPNQQNKQAKYNPVSEIKNKQKVTRREEWGDNGGEKGKGFQEQL